MKTRQKNKKKKGSILTKDKRNLAQRQLLQGESLKSRQRGQRKNQELREGRGARLRGEKSASKPAEKPSHE